MDKTTTNSNSLGKPKDRVTEENFEEVDNLLAGETLGSPITDGEVGDRYLKGKASIEVPAESIMPTEVDKQD